MDPVLIFAGIIGLSVFLYVAMDGFDLGVGILFPFAPGGSSDRETMMASVAPVWDGNETWLVLAGTGLFAGFPLAYATLLPAFYLPLAVLLIALVFRGVAFEFRGKAERSQPLWDRVFHVASVAAALMQGIMLGAFIQGIEVSDRRFTGGAFDWLTPFSLLSGLGLLSGYALLGCTWLIGKTEGGLQRWCFRLTPWLLAALLGFIALVSIATPLTQPHVAERWFTWPNLFYLSPVPLLTGALALLQIRAVAKRRDRPPFLLTLALFGLAYLGLAISLWPNIVPPSITLWEAAAVPASLRFVLVGLVVLMPIILAYTGFTYWVFRGKVRKGAGYGH